MQDHCFRTRVSLPIKINSSPFSHLPSKNGSVRGQNSDRERKLFGHGLVSSLERAYCSQNCQQVGVIVRVLWHQEPCLCAMMVSVVQSG